MSALHISAPNTGLASTKALCGLTVAHDRLVDHPSSATCRLCTRKNAADYRSLLLNHAAEELDFDPSSPSPYRSKGATLLDYLDARAIHASMRGETEARPLFSSVNSAVQALAFYLDEGASLASSSRPARFEGMKGSRGTGVDSNVTRTVDRVVGVRKCLEAAFRDGVSFGNISLSPELCFSIYLWRHAGRSHFTNNKYRECVKRSEVDTEWIVTEVARVAAVTLTPHQIALVVRRGNEAVSAFNEHSARQSA